MPSLPATTHETLQSPHTNRSFPSFTQPHLAADTASIAGGLLAYVVSLYVASRERKDVVEEGRYSEAKCGPDSDTEGDDVCPRLNGFALFARLVARDNIATK